MHDTIHSTACHGSVEIRFAHILLGSLYFSVSYKSNDYYLKLLIEEWCEGVIQGSNQEGQPNSRNKADIGEMRSLILERVASHLRKNVVKSLAVDIQGLTKVCKW